MNGYRHRLSLHSRLHDWRYLSIIILTSSALVIYATREFAGHLIFSASDSSFSDNHVAGGKLIPALRASLDAVAVTAAVIFLMRYSTGRQISPGCWMLLVYGAAVVISIIGSLSVGIYIALQGPSELVYQPALLLDGVVVLCGFGVAIGHANTGYTWRVSFAYLGITQMIYALVLAISIGAETFPEELIDWLGIGQCVAVLFPSLNDRRTWDVFHWLGIGYVITGYIIVVANSHIAALSDIFSHVRRELI